MRALIAVLAAVAMLGAAVGCGGGSTADSTPATQTPTELTSSEIVVLNEWRLQVQVALVDGDPGGLDEAYQDVVDLARARPDAVDRFSGSTPRIVLVDTASQLSAEWPEMAERLDRVLAALPPPAPAS